VGISILISKKHINNFGILFAKNCLLTFINHCKNELYGLKFVVYNVHLLTHICDDVEVYGSLDEYSSFLFESYLDHLKKLIKTSTNPLQQIHRQLHEINSSLLKFKEHNFKNPDRSKYFVDMEYKNSPLLNNFCESCKQYKKLLFQIYDFLSISIANQTVIVC